MQVLAHNLLSQFTNRQLKITTGNKSKTTERLSTGYRINRSADDAAGLTISEKMRWQIRGLGKAADNCQTGNSFCQVADGAMEEVESMLQRMRELSVQAANDTNTEEDRAAIQDEVDQLATEIGRITSDTQFNTLDVFGWERKVTNYVPDGNGGMVISGSPSTVVVQGNNYGLSEILGNGKIYNGTKLNDALQLSGTGWKSTGEIKYGYSGTISSVLNYLNSKYPQTVTEGQLLGNSGANGTSAYVDVASGMRLLITFDSSVQTLEGKCPATKIELQKGYCADPSDPTSFVMQRSVKTFRLSDYGGDTSGAVGYNNGRQYGAAWMDFSGLGTDYVLSDLYGQGFNTTCATCSKYYSISFTGNNCETTNADGVNYTYVASSRSPRLEINISGCATGSDIVQNIMSAVKSCAEFNDHYTQYAYNQSNDAKLYIYDNRNSYVTGGRSTFEPASRNEDGQLVIGDVVVTDPATGNQRVYSNKNMWIQSGALEESGFFIERPMINLSFLGIAGISVMDYESASSGISSCDVAIETLNKERSKIGAQQNRLERAVSINQNVEENTQAAESRLRDADMAKEMLDYSKHNILEQAGQAMLTQANQSAQGVLNLIQ